MSREGLSLSCDLYLRPGNFFLVDVAGVGRAHAKVIWRNGTSIGAKFITLMDLKCCDWWGAPEPDAGRESAHAREAAAEALALFRSRFAKFGD